MHALYIKLTSIVWKWIGCVKPGKFKADEIWKPGTEKSHVDVAETEKPKMILKEDNNLQHNTKTGKSCYYNISPGKVKSVFIQWYHMLHKMIAN